MKKKITSGEENTLENYLSHIGLLTNTDTSASKNMVKLMTIHMAKGLEFPYMFLCGLGDGLETVRSISLRVKIEAEKGRK